VYAAQAIPPIDAEIAEKGHLWVETNLGGWETTMAASTENSTALAGMWRLKSETL
jgi:hypothetical protein